MGLSNVMGDRLNLNAGSCSPHLESIYLKAKAWRERQAQSVVGAIFEDQLGSIELGRRKLADLYRIDSRALILHMNAMSTFHWFWVQEGLHKTSRVIVTDQEYDHFLWSWQALAQRGEVDLHVVAIESGDSDADIVEKFRDALGQETEWVQISHIASPTGRRLPIEAIASQAHAAGAKVFVDGAHGPGLEHPDLSAFDVYIGNTHKWLMNIPTAAFIYIKDREARLRRRPPMMNMYYNYTSENYDELVWEGGPTRFHYAMEYGGTRDRTAEVVLSDAIDLFHAEREERDRRWRAAWTRVRSAASTLGWRFWEDLAEPQTPMLTFYLPDSTDVAEAWRWCKKQGVDISFPTFRDRRWFRLSAAWFLPDDIEERIVRCFSDQDWLRG